MFRRVGRPAGLWLFLVLLGVSGTSGVYALPSEDVDNNIGTTKQELLDRATLQLLVGVSAAPDSPLDEPLPPVTELPPADSSELPADLEDVNLESFDENLSLTDFEAQMETEPTAPEPLESEFDGDSPDQLEVEP